MAKSDIEKVLTAFQGIAGRDADLAIKYMNPKKYIQHNPHAADGVEGLKEYISHFPRENHHLKVVRAFQDGPYVFTQEEGLILDQNIFFDIFRFEDDLIVEHWVFTAKAAFPNESGHNQTDGPTQAKLSEDKEKNKSIIRDFYDAVVIPGDYGKIPEYLAGDRFVRHDANGGDGVAAFMRLLALADQPEIDLKFDEIKFVFGQGDFVLVAAHGSVSGDPCIFCNLYRVEGNKIAEHWGIIEKIPPQEEWKNNNGML